MEKQVIQMNPDDNVVIALQAMEAGTSVTLPDGRVIVTKDKIPPSHKIAICDIPNHQPVIRYGEEIGYATCDISEGQWVHVHNLDAADIM